MPPEASWQSCSVPNRFLAGSCQDRQEAPGGSRILAREQFPNASGERQFGSRIQARLDFYYTLSSIPVVKSAPSQSSSAYTLLQSEYFASVYAADPLLEQAG